MHNKRYMKRDKNGNVLTARDPRLNGIIAKCGTCVECRREKAKEWETRLWEEQLSRGDGVFVTLTFTEKELKKLIDEVGNNDQKVAITAVRRFRERWRKKYKTSIRHFLVTELGHKNTQRLHLHGLLFTEREKWKEIPKIWKYGKQVYLGYETGLRCIKYVIKYIMKKDEDHEGYRSTILTSPGMGKRWLERNKRQYKFAGEETLTYIENEKGHKSAIPKYYKDRLWNISEREELRLIQEDKKEVYLNGLKYDLTNAEQRMQYQKALQYKNDEKMKVKDFRPEKRVKYTAREGKKIKMGGHGEKAKREEELKLLQVFESAGTAELEDEHVPF